MGIGLFGIKRNVTPFFVGSNGSDLVRGVYAFHLDIENGEILKKKFYKTNGAPVHFLKDERWIYVCYTNHSGRAQDGGVKQYATMDLQFGLTADVSNRGKTYVCSFVNYNRDHAYAVDFWNGEVIVMPILKHKIVTVSQTIKHEGKGIVARKQDEAHPAWVCDTPDHKYIIVSDYGTDEVVVYNTVEHEKLERNDELTIKLPAGSGPKQIAFNKVGDKAYIACAISNEIMVYNYKDGHFEFVDKYDTYPKDEFTKESEISSILLDEENGCLFASNKGHDSISAFKVNEDGTLKYIEFVDCDENPSSMIILKNKWLVVAAQKAGTLESFTIETNKRKGILYETGYSYSVGEPTCMIPARDLILDENGRVI